MDKTNPFAVQRDKHAFKRLPVGSILKNPNQPRRVFEASALQELAASIARYGVITPLTVRKKDTCYELIAGERRLRAAKMAGLETVPCYIITAREEDSGLMALVENLQRRDLDFFEEALSLQRLTRLYGLTQQQIADRIGKSQSAVANKLRLLRLAPETVEVIRLTGLTERHARVLLRIEDEAAQLSAAREMASRQMNVSQAEGYIEVLLSPPAPKKPAQSRQVLIKDVRILINTVDRAVSTMQKAGIDAIFDRRQEGDLLIMTLRVPASLESNVSRETKKAVQV